MSALLAHGLDAAREVDPARYALAGVAPRAALRPATREEVAAALAAAAREGLAVVPWGGGVGLARESVPPRYDLALDLRALDRIVEYDPEDLTLTAECGVSIEALGAAVAARGQELPLEAARAARATLGGTLAANASGARRLRFGAPRDRILGARFVLGDGTLARTGGKVVKNVAGYGIHRLLCGSRGGLGVLLEASLKLQPAPETRVALLFEARPAQLADAARWAPFPRLEPAGLTVVGSDAAAALPGARAPGAFAVIVGLEDEARWVERQAAVATATLGPALAHLEGDEVVRLWQAFADLEDREGALLTFATAHNTPAALAPLLERPEAASLVFHAPAGRLHLQVEPGRAQDAVRSLAAHGFSLIGSCGAGALEPALPPQIGVLALRARIRAELDPAGTLALGERWAAGIA
jgi:glycolate oxidase FAD binding subunit